MKKRYGFIIRGNAPPFFPRTTPIRITTHRTVRFLICSAADSHTLQTSAKKPVKNSDLWQQLDREAARHNISWHWIKGHSGHRENEIADELAGQPVYIRYNATHRSAEAIDEKGEILPSITLFWFAWYAFHPETEVFRVEK